MFAILNILIFILLSGYAFVLMLSKPSYFKLSKTNKVLLTGREKFLLLTLVTGMVSVGGVNIGVNLSALRLVLWMMMMTLAFFLFEKSPHLNKLIIIYAVFLLWSIITLIWSPDFSYGIRSFLKYLYPLIALVFASTFVQSKDFIFVAIRWMLISAFLYSFFLGGVMTNILGTWSFYMGHLFWPMATLTDYLAIMSAVSFVMWWRTKEKKYILLILWFILSALLQSVRTGVLSIGVMLMVGSFLRYKLTALPYIIGAFFIGIFIILFIPSIKEKMFFDPNKIQTINDISFAFEEGNINTSARAYMWEHLIQVFHKGHEWLGSGLGSVQQYMYENYVFGGLKAPHSDYIQMICDVGDIGLFLYLLFPLFLYRYTKKYIFKYPTTPLITSAILAILSYTAIFPAMGFDNVVNYSLAAHSYPFIFIGIFFKYMKQEKKFRKNNV